MLVTGLRVAPDAAFGDGHTVAVHVSGAQFAAIEDFVASSFERDAAGGPDFIAKGPYQGSLFYASTRTYDLLDTCNTWTVAALRGGGLPARVPFTVFAAQTLGQARRLGAEGY